METAIKAYKPSECGGGVSECVCECVVKNSTEQHHPTKIVFGPNSDRVAVGGLKCDGLLSTSKQEKTENDPEFPVMEGLKISETFFPNSGGKKHVLCTTR